MRPHPRIKLVFFGVGSFVGAAFALLVARAHPRHVDAIAHRVDAEAIFASAERPISIASDPIASESIVRPLSRAELELVYPNLGSLMEYDPQTYFRYRANVDFKYAWREHPRGRIALRTNSLGLRRESEVLEQRPDLRVLAIGDSHTDGVCGAEEAFPSLLERHLAQSHAGWTVEALNAGVGGYSFYNYLGALHRYLPLQPDVVVVTVFGGNDFEEALTLYHYFRGSVRPAWTADNDEQIRRATAVCGQPLVQGLLSAKYFAANPLQVEAALDAARSVTTEIVRACESNGVHPIIAYLPSLCALERPSQREFTERVAAALELAPGDLAIEDRIADEYLAFLRSQHVDTLDLRPAFDAADRELYWRADHHVNLEGHALIAELLTPVVSAAVSSTSEHARAPTAPAIALANPVVDFRDVYHVHVSREPLTPAAMQREDVARWFRLTADEEFEPDALFCYRPNLGGQASSSTSLRTNSLGLLGEREPRAQASPERVLLVGDEMVFARGDAGEHLGALVEQTLGAQLANEAECLDACTEGYGFYNALGTLDRFAVLHPRVAVVAVNAGNDFSDAVAFYRHFEKGTPRTHGVTGADELELRQFASAARRFNEHNAEARVAIQAGVEITLEIVRKCREAEVEPVIVLIPPASDPRAVHCRPQVEDACRRAGVAASSVAVIDNVSYVYREMLEQRGVAVHDFGASLAGSAGALFDPATFRLNEAGRKELATVITELVAPLLDSER